MPIRTVLEERCDRLPLTRRVSVNWLGELTDLVVARCSSDHRDAFRAPRWLQSHWINLSSRFGPGWSSRNLRFGINRQQAGRTALVATPARTIFHRTGFKANVFPIGLALNHWQSDRGLRVMINLLQKVYGVPAQSQILPTMSLKNETQRCLGVWIACTALAVTGCRTSPAAKEAGFLKRGQALLAQKDYPRALLEFRNAATTVPKDAEPYYQMGLAYLASGDGVGAIHAFQKATTLKSAAFRRAVETG